MGLFDWRATLFQTKDPQYKNYPKHQMYLSVSMGRMFTYIVWEVGLPKEGDLDLTWPSTYPKLTKNQNGISTTMLEMLEMKGCVKM